VGVEKRDDLGHRRRGRAPHHSAGPPAKVEGGEIGEGQAVVEGDVCQLAET
jgi:hypothetical protein